MDIVRFRTLDERATRERSPWPDRLVALNELLDHQRDLDVPQQQRLLAILKWIARRLGKHIVRAAGSDWYVEQGLLRQIEVRKPEPMRGRMASDEFESILRHIADRGAAWAQRLEWLCTLERRRWHSLDWLQQCRVIEYRCELARELGDRRVPYFDAEVGRRMEWATNDVGQIVSSLPTVQPMEAS